MSKDKSTLQVPEIGDASRDHSYRHSLQPKGVTEGPTLRHTQSQNYGAKKKKVKVPPIPEVPSIPEVEAEVKIEIVNEQGKVSEKEREKKKRHSKGSRRSSQTSSRLGFDNAAFEVEDGLKIHRGNTNSAASSVRSSLRDPSVQSLTSVREQYWCCAKWTPCERTLFAVVGILAVIIIILITVIAIVATSSSKAKEVLGLLSIFDPPTY